MWYYTQKDEVVIKYNGHNVLHCDFPTEIDVADGARVKIGDAVVAENDENGVICEGNVEMVLPYGLEFMDKTWDATVGCVVIRDHESKTLSTWDPRKVTKLIGGGEPTAEEDNDRIDAEAKEMAKQDAITELKDALKMAEQGEWQCAADATAAALQQFSIAGY